MDRTRPSPAETMRVFDSLPKPLRQAIAGAAFVYEPEDIAVRILRGRKPETILRGIVRYERRAAQ
ncbi:hypothetical protein G6M50_36800 [Agrobacterium rhizogenes]|nr:hypothetical protein [Rhizobium rhizogenes]NTJ83347.1 hypothetical protein [Rhizobium rhizogenes]